MPSTIVAGNPFSGRCRPTGVTDDNGPHGRALTDLAFHILIALGEGRAQKDAIGKDVATQSSGRLDPSTGALYQALHRLKEEGLVAPAGPPERCDERRKYFQLTRLGRREPRPRPGGSRR